MYIYTYLNINNNLVAYKVPVYIHMFTLISSVVNR